MQEQLDFKSLKECDNKECDQKQETTVDDLIAAEADEWLNGLSLTIPAPRRSATKKQYNYTKVKKRRQIAKASQRKNRKKNRF